MLSELEKTELVRIALNAELDGYKNKNFEEIYLMTKDNIAKFEAIIKWLESAKEQKALYNLYLEICLMSTEALNPKMFNFLERI